MLSDDGSTDGALFQTAFASRVFTSDAFV